MEEKNIITLIDPDGKEAAVEYVIDFDLDGTKYLVYDKGEEENDNIDCYIVKLTSDEDGYVVENIEDEEEFARVTKKLDELIVAEED